MLEDAYKKMENKQQKNKKSGNVNENVKFTEEEMGELKVIQQQYIAVQSQLGQLAVTKLRIEQQFNNIVQAENDVKGKYKETQEKEQEFISTITEKYGDGKLDLDSGDFRKDDEKNKK